MSSKPITLSNQALNIWLAEHLFKFEWRVSSNTGRRGLFPPDHHPDWFKNLADKTEDLCADCYGSIPNYSENMGDAWLVWNKMLELGWFCVLKEMPEGQPFILELDNCEDRKLFRRSCAEFKWVSMDTEEDIRKKMHVHTFTVADTSARAICESAKRAVEQTQGDWLFGV